MEEENKAPPERKDHLSLPESASTPYTIPSAVEITKIALK